MQKIISIILLLLAFHTWKLGAQSASDRWTSYLEPGIVNDYLEEADKLYLATDAGVFVMDKSTHAVLEHWTKQSVGIPSNRVESIRRNATTHQIFIGTYDIAAISVQNTDGSWENIPYPEDVVAGVGSGNSLMTYCIEFDQENRLWIGTSNGALRYDANATGNNWKWYNEGNTGLFFRSVWDMAKDAEGRMLLGSNLLFRTAGEDLEQLSPMDANGNPFNLLFSYSDANVHAQADGTVWFFTDVGSVGRYDGEIWHISSNIDNPDFFFQQLDFLTEDREGKLWAHLGWQGFVRYNAENDLWEAAAPVANSNIENPNGLYFSESGPILSAPKTIEWHDANGVSTETLLGNYPFEGALWNLKQDHEGNLWGLEYQNTSRLRNLESGAVISLNDDGAPLYISDYAFTNEGILWAISGKRVLRKTDDGWEVFDYTNSDLPDASGFNNLTIDSYGRIWIAVYSNGIYRYDSANGWKHFSNAALVQNFVIDLEAGADGQVWVSLWYSNQGGRLGLITDQNLSIFNLNLGSSYYSLNVLKFDAQSNRLYGGGSGFGYWENGSWHAMDLPVDFGTTQYITSIEITNGRIIAATRETLLLYDGNDWEVFTAENSPLQRRDIYDVGFDANTGRVWMAYSSLRALDVYQTDFLVNATSPGDHLNQFVVQISPNPFSGHAVLNYEMAQTETQVLGRVYSLQGQLLRNFEWDGAAGKHTQLLGLEDLEAGVYVLEIVAGKQRKSLKVVRQ